jgi:fumarylacetoacetate (FAA) hydrolase
MRLATLRDGTRDGALVIVDRAGERCASANPVAANLQQALDDWDRVEPALRRLTAELEGGIVTGEPLDSTLVCAPLPRAFEWIDGSAYLNHIELVRKARGAPLPVDLLTVPLVYQGGSGVLLGPTDPIVLPDPAWGLDFEAELCAIFGDVPRGVSAAHGPSPRLLMLANDLTYRELVPAELAKGFGFFVSKPATAFSPFAVTPDELGLSYRDGRAYLRLRSTYNGAVVGDVDTGPEMHFSFVDLLAHLSRSRALTAGTIVGGGTVSNRDRSRGVSCLVERRMIETIEDGAPRTPYMQPGDTIRIEAFDGEGKSVFGAIHQRVQDAQDARRARHPVPEAQTAAAATPVSPRQAGCGDA